MENQGTKGRKQSKYSLQLSKIDTNDDYIVKGSHIIISSFMEETR